jgi:acetolactate synthase-1/2/3 large subunit
VDSGLPAVLDVEIEREIIPPDFEVLAAVWLEGCELPKPEEEERKEKVSVVA